MQPLLTPEQMAQADRATIDAGTPAEVLMDRAGRAVARAALDLMGNRYGKRAVIVCGKGNNGGDGFVAARVLRGEGVGVRCLVLFDPSDAQGAAAHHFELLRASGVAAEPFDEGSLEHADVVIDAIFGTGFSGEPRAEAAKAIAAINASKKPVVAVDIPSGVDGATGAAGHDAIRADVTVALGAQKFGTATGEGAERAGDVILAPIGISGVEGDFAWSQRKPAATWMLTRDDVVLAARAAGAHKRSSGSVLVIAGSDLLPGAAVLTASAALVAGSGYVTLGSTERTCAIASARTPELVTASSADRAVLGPRALDDFSAHLDRVDVVAIGPGLGAGTLQRDLVTRVLREVSVPVVIDADGLNVLAGRTELIAGREGDTILTPHPAELARLLGIETKAVQDDRLGIAERAARTLRCIVLLKGHRSVVAAFDAETDDVERWVIPTGGPELATAGTGDVLTGVLAASVAARPDHPRSAAVSSAYLHGVAGDVAGSTTGGMGVTAVDVLEALPEAQARLR